MLSRRYVNILATCTEKVHTCHPQGKKLSFRPDYVSHLNNVWLFSPQSGLRQRGKALESISLALKACKDYTNM